MISVRKLPFNNDDGLQPTTLFIMIELDQRLILRILANVFFHKHYSGKYQLMTTSFVLS